MVLIWSADGACVLKAWGEPPVGGGGCNRCLLALMHRRCASVGLPNVPEVHSMARHGLTWCIGHTHAQACHTPSQAYTAQVPAPGAPSPCPASHSHWLSAQAVHQCNSLWAAGCRLPATVKDSVCCTPQQGQPALHSFSSPLYDVRIGSPTSEP